MESKSSDPKKSSPAFDNWRNSQTTDTKLDLAFVNRENSVQELAKVMMGNSQRAVSLIENRRQGDKYVMPFSGHLFGAGKTRLGEVVLAQAKRFYDDADLKRKWDYLYSPKEVQMLFNSTRVEINLEKWRLPSDRNILDTALADFFYDQFVSALDIKEPRPVEVKQLGQVIKWVREVSKLSGIYLHIDEISDVTHRRFDNCFGWLPIPLTTEANASDQSVIDANLCRYYDVWKLLVSELEDIPGVYLYLTGKQPYLDLIGRGLYSSGSSPSFSTPIRLECLAPKYIAETIEKTEHKGEKLRTILGLNNEEKCKELSTVLFEETAGLPRLINSTLNKLVDYPEVLTGNTRYAVMLAMLHIPRP